VLDVSAPVQQRSSGEGVAAISAVSPVTREAQLDAAPFGTILRVGGAYRLKSTSNQATGGIGGE